MTIWVCSDCDYETPGGRNSPEATEHNETTGHELRWMYRPDDAVSEAKK